MRRLTPLSLLILILVLATTAQAQGSLDTTIASLQKQIQVREAIDRDRKTHSDLRILNRRVLEAKRVELLEAVRLRIEQLQDYLVHPATLRSEHKQHAETSLRYLVSIRDGVADSRGSAAALNLMPTSTTRARIVVTDRTAQSLQRAVPQSATDRKDSKITLDPLRAGDIMIRGRSALGISEIIVQIRTWDSAYAPSQPVGLLYSHSTPAKRQTDLVAYRVVRSAALEHGRDNWQFTVRLARPLTRNQEVRALSGTEVTQWAGVRGTPPSSALVKTDSSTQITRVNQTRDADDVRDRRRARAASDTDQCAGRRNLRQIRIYWDTGNVSPSRLKQSGPYCIEVIGANTILYSYLVDVDVESPTGNPFEILGAAIAVLKTGFGAQKAAGGDGAKGDKNLRPCPLPSRIDAVTEAADGLQTALSAMEPKVESGKRKSVPLYETIAAFQPVSGKFQAFKDAIDNLRIALNPANIANTDCNAEQIRQARQLVATYDEVERRYELLRDRVDSPPPVRVYEELEATDKVKISVREMYERQQTAAEVLVLNVAPGYSLISASAGALITRVPARSYHNRVAPDPANPTATQSVLSIDNGSGTRPALTALLHYNLPFVQKQRIGFALSAGPVYDISGGKAETSKLGLFGGVSVRFSDWLYLTPGFHIGEFADYPEGFTRAGQVVPSNITEPQPVKRYTTKFGFAVTFKVKDLGGSETPAPDNK